MMLILDICGWNYYDAHNNDQLLSLSLYSNVIWRVDLCIMNIQISLNQFWDMIGLILRLQLSILAKSDREVYNKLTVEDKAHYIDMCDQVAPHQYIDIPH